MQVCSECQEDRDATAFHRSKSYNDGLYGKCKRCCAAALSRRRASGDGTDVGGSGGAEWGPAFRSAPTAGRTAAVELMSAEDIATMLMEATHYGDDVAKVGRSSMKDQVSGAV